MSSIDPGAKHLSLFIGEKSPDQEYSTTDTATGKFRSGLDTDFIVMILLASRLKGPESGGLVQEKDPAPNQMRMAEMVQPLYQVIPKTTSDGVILFAGGWFHTGKEPTSTLYAWVGDAAAKSGAGGARVARGPTGRGGLHRRQPRARHRAGAADGHLRCSCW